MSDLNISIVLPTYNVESYVERCIHSLQNQTIKDFEMVFVDDCGIDSSIKIIKEYAKKDKRIKIVHHKKNLGTYFARKTGVENATGEYIVFLDPDDELAPDTIRKLANKLNKTPDLVLFGSKRFPELRFWQTKAKIPSIHTEMKKAESVNKILDCKSLNRGIAGKAIKKSCLLDAYKLLDVEEDAGLVYGEDQLLFLAIIYEASTFSSVKSPLYIYHINESSITSSVDFVSVNRNISQINNIIQRINGLRLDDKEGLIIKINFVNSLRCHELRLRNRIDDRPANIVLGYIELIKISRSIKDFFKFAIYLITLGKINRI